MGPGGIIGRGARPGTRDRKSDDPDPSRGASALPAGSLPANPAMSRRCHHGSPRHARPVLREQRRGPALVDRATPQPSSPDGRRDEIAALAAPASGPVGEAADAVADLTALDRVEPEVDVDVVVAPIVETPQPAVQPPVAIPARAVAPPRAATVPADLQPEQGPSAQRPGPIDHGATAPQLRRFIKSRAYVPMHELRRRFAINGGDDDVTALEVDRRIVYVGLPPREGRLLGELLSGGDIGVELSLDPVAPIVVGVFPTRPIPRS